MSRLDHINGVALVFNNAGDHWLIVIPSGVVRHDGVGELHRIATWRIKLKEIPENKKFEKGYSEMFYDSHSFSPDSMPFLSFRIDR